MHRLLRKFLKFRDLLLGCCSALRWSVYLIYKHFEISEITFEMTRDVFIKYLCPFVSEMFNTAEVSPTFTNFSRFKTWIGDLWLYWKLYICATDNLLFYFRIMLWIVPFLLLKKMYVSIWQNDIVWLSHKCIVKSTVYIAY